MVLVAMVYSNGFLNSRLAENEFTTNKQFMLTTGLQIDDIAWTLGRAQTVRYSSTYGAVTFQNGALNYTVEIFSEDGGSPLNFSYQTGIILFNMPTSVYTVSNGYFERIFPKDSRLMRDGFTADTRLVQNGSTAAVSHVNVVEKLPMTAGNFTSVAIVPSIRIMNSSINGQNYARLYLPLLEGGSNPSLSQSITLIGKAVSHYIRQNVTSIQIKVSYPASTQGFDSQFFKFHFNSSPDIYTLNSTSDPPLPSNPVVEFYVGEVTVSLGLYS
jgi:hypothetical protein